MAVIFLEDNGLIKCKLSNKCITVYPIIMDKITITFNVTEQYHNHLLDCMKNDKPNSMYKKAIYLEVARQWPPYTPSNKESTTKAYLQAGPRLKINFCRLTFTPSKVREIAELRSKIDQVMPFSGGWDHIVKNGTVTRMDLAVDVVNVNIDELLFSYGKIQITGVNTKRGRTEYLGGWLNSGKMVVIYDKVAQIKNSNSKEFFSKYRDPVPELPVTRLEIRLDDNLPELNKKSIGQLSKLTNPFLNLLITYTDSMNNNFIDPWVLELFLRLAKFEGAHAALSAFPSSYQSTLKYKIKSAPPKWWRPKHTWRGYQDLLDRLSIDHEHPTMIL